MLSEELLIRIRTNNSALRRLNFSYEEISDSDAEKIADALRKNTTLAIINFTKNNLSKKGKVILVSAVAESLRNNPNLIKLVFSDNGLENPDVVVLANAWGLRNGLEELDLSCNSIGNLGSKFIAKNLQENSRLTSLNLSHNQLTSSEMEFFSEALKNNSVLTSFNVQGNKEVKMKGIETILERNYKDVVMRGFGSFVPPPSPDLPFKNSAVQFTPEYLPYPRQSTVLDNVPPVSLPGNSPSLSPQGRNICSRLIEVLRSCLRR